MEQTLQASFIQILTHHQQGSPMRWKQISNVLMVGMTFAATPLWAQSFTNGSLSGTCANSGVPADWSILSQTPDTVDPTCNVGFTGLAFAAPASFSPDGGSWVGLGREVTGFVERFGQTVAGFTIGQNYRVSWYVSNFGYDDGFGYTNPNQIEVLLGGVSVGAGSMLSLGAGWFAQSLTFTATATSQALAFQLGTNNKSYMGIDGLALSPATVVPEPATMTLLAVGLAGLATARRRKRKA